MSYWHLGPMPGRPQLEGFDFFVSRYLNDALPEHVVQDLQLSVHRDPVTHDLVFVSCAYREEVLRISGSDLRQMTEYAGDKQAMRAVKERVEKGVADYYEPILIMRRAQVGG